MDQKTISKNSITAFSIAALVFGVLSLVTCCTGILPIAAGGLSILFVVLSRRQGQPLPQLSVLGLVLSCIGILLGLFLTTITLVYVIIPMFTDPNAYQELNTFYKTYYGMSLDEMLGGWDPTGYWLNIYQ